MRNVFLVAVLVAVTTLPACQGMQLGESTAAPAPAADQARSWDAVVAQVMLLDDGLSCLDDVIATRTAMSVRFTPASRAEVMRDVARVARILSAGDDVNELVISAPETSWVRAAATAGGFPPERIRAYAETGSVTIQATRVPAEQTIRSAQR
jgi:hypothetical protein